jgi:hypothetical protein
MKISLRSLVKDDLYMVTDRCQDGWFRHGILPFFNFLRTSHDRFSTKLFTKGGLANLNFPRIRFCLFWKVLEVAHFFLYSIL